MGPHPVTSSKPNSSHSHYFPCITPWGIRASICEERREMASIQSRTEGWEMTSEERWLVQQIQACFLLRFLCNKRTTGKHWNRKTCSVFCHYRFIFSGLKTFLLEPGLASGLLPERWAGMSPQGFSALAFVCSRAQRNGLQALLSGCLMTDDYPQFFAAWASPPVA